MIHQAARIGFILAAPALAMLLSSSAPAVTRSWDAGGGANTDWTTDANWTLNTEPGASDTAEFDLGAAVTYTVTFPVLIPFPGDITTDRLIVGSNAVTFEPDHSNTDYIAATSATDETGRGIIIGEEANDTAAALTSHLGLLSTAAATLGHVAGSSGTLTLNQNNDQFNVTGGGTGIPLIIGRYGTGVLSVSGGADVNVTGSTVLGLYSGSNGTIDVSNANSVFTNSGSLTVGDPFTGGIGTLNVSSGGTLNTPTSDIGNGTTSVTGANSRWNYSGGLSVGRGGVGTLNISDGGSVVTGTTDEFIVGFSGSGYVNVTSGGQLSTAFAQLGVSDTIGYGAVTVAGAGSIWTNVSGGTQAFVIGFAGSPGAINILDGGRFTNDIPGDVDISRGNVSVEGAGSSWTASATYVHGMMTVSNGGTVNGFVDVVGGTLKGNGSIAGIVYNDSIVAPGESLGALHILNVGGFTTEYRQQSSGRLQIELGGTTPDSEYDQLLVAGKIVLGGTLQVSLVSPFSPAVGDSFNILDWGGTLTGTFATLNLPGLTGNLVWNTTALYTSGVISVVLPGDYNGNGIVDAADYAVWRDTLGQLVTAGTGADGNGNGAIDNGDYDFWRAHFGQTASSGSGTGENAAVPEPATAVMLIVGILAMCSRRRAAVS